MIFSGTSLRCDWCHSIFTTSDPAPRDMDIADWVRLRAKNDARWKSTPKGDECYDCIVKETVWKMQRLHKLYGENSEMLCDVCGMICDPVDSVTDKSGRVRFCGGTFGLNCARWSDRDWMIASVLEKKENKTNES